jgi:hypothetical protein
MYQSYSLHLTVKENEMNLYKVIYPELCGQSTKRVELSSLILLTTQIIEDEFLAFGV